MSNPDHTEFSDEIADPGRLEMQEAIDDLVRLAGPREPEEARRLAAETITAVIRLMRDRAPIADVKMLNAAVKEFRYADLVFRPYDGIRKVCIFGSARTHEGDENYERAEEFASEITRRGWMVVTGGGPGIMAAANAGAGAERSFGLRIHLPFEPGANPTLAEDRKLINFRYFFTRKVFFMKESHAFVLLPGGFGTLDEAFELLTLIQTGRSDMHPVVLLENPGGSYWQTWHDFLGSELVSRSLIDEDDLALFRIAATADSAVAEIERFYSNYHSERYVDGRLILRMHRAPGEKHLAELSRRFADILTDGKIEKVDAAEAERRDDDFPELDRLALSFDRSSYARLRLLIDAINESH